MDLADSYRTRFAPKEHEEAVRMLLEGIDKQQVEDRINNRPTLAQRPAQVARMASATSRETIKDRMMAAPKSTMKEPLDDRKSLNSSSAGTYSSGIVDSHEDSGNGGIASMQSKSTTTSESISTRSAASGSDPASMAAAAADEANGCVVSGDLIPSRTIAVQCDLKASSVRLFDTSMQASSISSTRYGFYNYNRETLEKRHRLQRSASNRNLSKHSTLSEATDRQQQLLDTNEAPTSMSELSSSGAASELSVSDHDIDHDRQNDDEEDEKMMSLNPASQPKKSDERFNQNDVSQLQSHDRTSNSAVRRKSLADENANRTDSAAPTEPTARLTKGNRQLYGSVLDNSSSQSVARARINSLPRRPRTALSYVSANRLRHHQQDDGSDLEDSSIDIDNYSRNSSARARDLGKSRAISQQSLNRPKTPMGAHRPSCSSSNASSDSELASNPRRRNPRTKVRRYRNGAGGGGDNDSDDDDDDEENRSEETLLTMNRTRPAEATTVQRPKHVESSHDEEGQNLKEVFGRRDELRQNDEPKSYQPMQTRFRDGCTRELRATDGRRTAIQAGSMRLANGGGGGGEQIRARPVDRRFSSTMSLSRRIARPQHNGQTLEDYPTTRTGSNEVGGSSKPRRLDSSLYRSERALNQSPIRQSSRLEPIARAMHDEGRQQSVAAAASPIVGRSISMRQISRPGVRRHEAATDGVRRLSGADQSGEEPEYPSRIPANSSTSSRTSYSQPATHISKRPGRSQTLRAASKAMRPDLNANDDELLASKNWANPAGATLQRRGTAVHHQRADLDVGSRRRSQAIRSMSMRDPNGRHRSDDQPPGSYGSTMAGAYRAPAGNFAANYNEAHSSSESSGMAAAETVRNFAARLSPLDYDSQQRLNESGLPEVNEPHPSELDTYLTGGTRLIRGGPVSYLGGVSADQQHQHRLLHHASQDGLQNSSLQSRQHHFSSSNTLNGRNGGIGGGGGGGQIKGRAMSQQSLTRPTMPALSGGRRWLQAAGGDSAASDVGGSSMSLATRLQGRYENAHTRSPIVMYIPPATPKSGSLRGEDSLLGGTRLPRTNCSTLGKKGSRSRDRSRPGSQDRSMRRRSVSKNGSDSESSSILRTLVRARRGDHSSSAYSSKRIARMQNIPVNNIDSDDEDMDGVGRLATEVDSYKFIRRYSVPKDAKINWFARLRQRVASSANR